VAVNCCVAPCVIVVTAGATVIDSKIDGPSAPAVSAWLAPISPASSATGSTRAATRRRRPRDILPIPRDHIPSCDVTQHHGSGTCLSVVVGRMGEKRVITRLVLRDSTWIPGGERS
jgi:hypothetical protein